MMTESMWRWNVSFLSMVIPRYLQREFIVSVFFFYLCVYWSHCRQPSSSKNHHLLPFFFVCQLHLVSFPCCLLFYLVPCLLRLYICVWSRVNQKPHPFSYYTACYKVRFAVIVSRLFFRYFVDISLFLITHACQMTSSTAIVAVCRLSRANLAHHVDVAACIVFLYSLFFSVIWTGTETSSPWTFSTHRVSFSQSSQCPCFHFD